MKVSPMKVTADLDLCQGHQMCLVEAPDVFGFDHDQDHVVVLAEHPDEAQRPQIDQAVKYCPAMALAVHDDPTPPTEEQDR